MERAIIDLEMEKVEPAVNHLVGTPDLALHMVAATDSLVSNDNFTLDRLQRQEVRLARLESRAQAQLQALKAARLKERELALQERRLALEEATLAAATTTAAVQKAQNLDTSPQPTIGRNSNSGNNLTVLIPAATSPDLESSDKAA